MDERTLYADGLDLAVRDEAGLRAMSHAELMCVAALLDEDYGRISLVQGYIAGIRIIAAEQLELEPVS